MKRCPKCRRDYYDETLLYCLDDGERLLDGPVSTDEPATAIMQPAEAVGEAPTRAQFETTGRTARPPSGINELPRRSFDKRFIAVPFLLTLIVLGGFFGYRYWGYHSGQIESVAVMPFANESGDPDIEYLSDGMTESLIHSLSQLPNLNVKARSSVFRYKGKETDAPAIGKELSVQAILNGRVVQKSDGLTLYLELVDAQTGNRIWGDRYDRKASDLISLQADIARDVSQKLRTKLSGADEQKLKKNYTENVEAYQLYLKGRYHVFKLTPPDVRKSIEYFQSAIEVDPAYALAYAGISDAYRSLALAGEMDPSETLPKATAAAKKAIEIDDDLADGHAALGVCLFWYDWNWAASEDQFRRAIDLNPNNSLAHLFYAHLLSNIGRHPEALAEVKRARDLDPLSPFVSTLEGQFLLRAGKADEALARLRQASELDPNFFFPHIIAASVYIEKEMYAEAAEEGRRATELGPTQTVGTAFEAYALAKQGKRDQAQTILNDLLKLSNQRFVPPYHIAVVFHALGETDNSLAWLEKGYEVRDPKMAFLRIWPQWNDLRSNPRFEELMKKLAFP
jgi:TolB-like protein/Tfp pilus assembly protein PilF